MRRPAYASYGDASHTNFDFLKDVEVLATVEEDITDHGITWPPHFEVKYSYYEKLKKRQPAAAAKWDYVLSQASVYVFDPQPTRERFEDDWRYLFNTRELRATDHSTWWA